MKKEKMKSLLLTSLVLSSLFFTGQIWFNEKLWPEGYNFFVSIQTSALGQAQQLFGEPVPAQNNVKTQPILPHHFVAYTVKDFDHAGLILTPRHEQYEPVYAYAKDILKHALIKDSKSLLKLSEEDWQKALYTRGLYLDYGINYKIDTFASLMGVSDSPLADILGTVRRFIITPSDALTNDVHIYLHDENSKNFYRLSSGMNKLQLEETLAALSEKATPKNRFSFFLDADTSTEDAGEAVFNSYLVLSEEGEFLPSVKSFNPLMRDGSNEIGVQKQNRLLHLFDMNPNTVRKYTDAEENLVFVQNQATLKISANGSVDYHTVSGNGLRLSDFATTSTKAFQGISMAIGFAQTLQNAFDENSDVGLYLSSFMENENKTVATFDYRCGGTPVILTGEYQAKSAVTVELEGGYLKNYTHILRGYEFGTQTYQALSTYSAVDLLFSRLSQEQREKRVEDLTTAYDDDGSEGEKHAGWFIKLEGQADYLH